MSFSLPKNVPSFENSQRAYENEYWNSAKRGQNGHGANGFGMPLGGIFNNRDLPMYKDKPYSYAASRRQAPLWKRKRFWLGVVLSLITIFYSLNRFAFGGYQQQQVKSKSKSQWSWLQRTRTDTVDWDLRRESVKEAFKLSWDGYERYAWGYDEWHPISKTGTQMTPNGLGWIIVDALDTLMIMNLTSQLKHAREWISTSLNYDQDKDVNTFETTIRMLGGLLSAHYLSTTFPEMAPLTEDDFGKPGEDLYVEKATDLADRLLGAFETESGVPFASINLKSLKGLPSHDDGGASSTAEASSLQLEFKYLAMLTGEKDYWTKAEKAIKVIDDNGAEDGLVPIFIYPDQGTFRGDNIRLGSRGDSYYEYLIKQYLQTAKEEPIYLDMWDQALAGVRQHLVTYTKNAHLTIIAERPSGIHEQLSPKMDHLVCFMPGTIALAATEGLPLSQAKKLSRWGKKQEDEMELARELTKTCWGMYKFALTGLAPEITHFEIEDPPHMESDGKLVSAEIDFNKTGAWKSDYIIKEQDQHNLQRPETVESLFYMWRITGDVMYREWGWEMFTSFLEYTAVEGGLGFTSLLKANVIPPILKDNMESFWLAETLKYFYLLFSPPDLLPLDSIVINTEAHVFPRFKLQRGLKTGWTRKPRDAAGRATPGREERPADVVTAKKETTNLKTVKVVDASHGVPTSGSENSAEEKGITSAPDAKAATTNKQI